MAIVQLARVVGAQLRTLRARRATSAWLSRAVRLRIVGAWKGRMLGLRPFDPTCVLLCLCLLPF